LWASARRDGGFDLVNAAAGAAPRLVQTFPSDYRHRSVPHLAASSRRWVVENRLVWADGGPVHFQHDQLEAFAGPAGGPLEPLYQPCVDLNDQLLTLRSVDVDGDRYVFRGPGCAGELIGASLANADSKPPAMMELPAGAIGLRVAGHYGAWLVPAIRFSMVVFDLAAGREAYRVELAARFTSPVYGPVASFELQADGKVALSYYLFRRHSFAMRVAWASPQQPRLHILGLPPAAHYSLRLAANQIALLRAASSSTGMITNGTLELRSLTGRLLHVVARGVDDQLVNERFDFDGRHVAYVTHNCDGAEIHVTAGGAPTANYRPPTHCP
jgi:hypothetical protein